MVDIALDLPDNLVADYELHARATGVSAEDLMRRTIIENAPPRLAAAENTSAAEIADEPVVKAAEIEKECRRLGYKLGWRFITCPQQQASTAKLLLVSLNPAGREVHGPSWSQEQGVHTASKRGETICLGKLPCSGRFNSCSTFWD